MKNLQDLIDFVKNDENVIIQRFNYNPKVSSKDFDFYDVTIGLKESLLEFLGRDDVSIHENENNSVCIRSKSTIYQLYDGYGNKVKQVERYYYIVHLK